MILVFTRKVRFASTSNIYDILPGIICDASGVASRPYVIAVRPRTGVASGLTFIFDVKSEHAEVALIADDDGALPRIGIDDRVACNQNVMRGDDRVQASFEKGTEFRVTWSGRVLNCAPIAKRRGITVVRFKRHEVTAVTCKVHMLPSGSKWRKV